MAKNAKKSSANKYGPVLKSGKAEEFAMKIFRSSRVEKAGGRKGLPVCSWGEAGIGKTELPNLLVKKYLDFFDGNIVYLPMAQIEEKAELQGLPELQTTKRVLQTSNYKLTKLKGKPTKNQEVISETTPKGITEYVASPDTTPSSELGKISYPDNKFVCHHKNYVICSTDSAGKKTLYLCTPEELDGSQTIMEEYLEGSLTKYVVDARTIYATPSWIPQVSTHGEKGLLVIDDMNRADGRIINSIMQLLQDGALLGWKLPEKWEIYCTCNPDDGNYDVTAFDGAQMTRMCNYEQRFDKDTWLESWAIPTGIHPIAQNFVMTHPEIIVKGERTNPRSFDKFFRIIYPILDQVKISGDKMELSSKGEGGKLAKEINDFGLMNIEEDSLQSFIAFLTCGYGKLPGIDEIISKKFDLNKFYSQITEGTVVRLDILSTLNTRLILHIQAESDEISRSKEKMEGIKKWLKAPNLPADLRWGVVEKALSHLGDLADAELSELVFSRLAARG